MLKFFSENSLEKFKRTNLSDMQQVKEYKYLSKIKEGKVQYILNLSTLELAVLKGISLEQLIKNINSGEDRHKQELLEHNFIIGAEEDSLEISKNISNLWHPKPKYSETDKSIVSYLIFTTTDCNARCFYCYEKGCKKETMTVDTADELIKYMKRHYKKDTELSLKWFGGEPLYNSSIIDYITSELHKANMPFKSRMISNGYLLNQEIINKAINQWNLTTTQITLDGTKEVYNKTKDYIYNDNNAFETVVKNIELAVNSGLKVRLRFNVSLTNVDDLIQLMADLKNIWSEETRSKLSGYAHMLFQIEESKSDYTDEFIAKYDKLETDIEDLFMKSSSGRKSKIKLKRGCMTTNSHQVGVLPNGDLCSCEHFEEEAPWGSIFNDDTKPRSVIEKWASVSHLVDEKCDECLYYPLCYGLTYCPGNRQLCNPMLIKTRESAVSATLKKLISKYKKSLKSD